MAEGTKRADKAMGLYLEKSREHAKRLAEDDDAWAEIERRLAEPPGERISREEFRKRFLSD